MSKYTSNLLCHFVGRTKKSDEEKFQLLINIIKGGKLIANLSDPEKPESYFQSGYECDNLGEVFGKCDCVCFCDIPNEALAIHTKKYSEFGMGFEKAFIAEQGAHPVMYVPTNYPIVERGEDKSGSSTPRQPQQYFPYILECTCNLLPLIEFSNIGVNLKQREENLRKLGLGPWLDSFNPNIRDSYFGGKYHPLLYSIIQGVGNQMSYVKLYDVSLPDEHPDNYYMEREWRSLNNVSFDLSSVKTIYLPSERYKDLFLTEFPKYNGEFYVFN